MRAFGKPALCESSVSALSTTWDPQDQFLRTCSLSFTKIVIKGTQTYLLEMKKKIKKNKTRGRVCKVKQCQWANILKRYND